MKWIVYNATDGIIAHHETFKTKREAENFKKEFPNRFAQQGYYLTSRRERISPKDVKLLVMTEEEFWNKR